MNKFLVEYMYYLNGELNLSQNTVISYKRDIEQYIDFIKTYRNKSNPEEIELHDIRNYLGSLKRKFNSSATIARNITSIKGFHRFLFLEKYTTRNVARTIRSPKQEQKLPIILSIKEVELLRSVLKTDNHLEIRNKAMIELTYSCGLRVGELVQMQLSDLLFSQGLIKVLGKGKKERLIPINKEAIDSVNLYIEQARPFLRSSLSKNYLFLSNRGGPMPRASFNSILKDKGIEAGIRKKITPHMLRHSFASHLLQRGLDLRYIQELLGHEDISTTEIYTHIYNTKLESVYLKAHPRAKKGK